MKKLLLILLCLPFIGFGQNVNIPDANFKAYLVGYSAINTNGDTEIQVSEAATYNGSISCDNMLISDLTGIEYFTALTNLFCYNNQIQNLDLSNNLNLSWLWCENNQLTYLDITQNVNLVNLTCQNNNLTYIDLSGQNSFINLYLSGNNLNSLDLSHFACGSIAEPSIDSNPNLECIQVNNVSCWDSAYTWSIDTSFQYFSTNCSSTTLQENTVNKVLLKITDLLGREAKGSKNEPLLYLYDDGTVEKRIILKK